MSTYLLVEFPSIELARDHYIHTRATFGTRCSCIGRSETDPRVAFFLFKDDLDPIEYQSYLSNPHPDARLHEVTF